MIDAIKDHIECHDKLIELFGMEIIKVIPGNASVAMKVQDNHLNAAGLCHGAAIFALADVAFALACNSHGTMALALEVSINYLRPASKGSTLTAFAEEINRGRKTALYSIRVTDEENRKVAYLKATAFRLSGKRVTDFLEK